MKLKYSDITLEQCYNSSLIFETICDADSRTIDVSIKKEYEKVFDNFVKIYDVLKEIMTSLGISVGTLLKDLSKIHYKRVKKGRRYILKRIK